MSKFKSVFTKVMAGLSAVIFLIGLFVFVSVLRASAGKVPSVLGYSFLQIQSGSMAPEYPIGSVIVTKRVDTESLEVDDVISFYAVDGEISGKVNTHRIVEKARNLGGGRIFITKGDANEAVDALPVSEVNIIGKVCYNLGTVSGSVISVLQNPNVIFFLIVLPLIFITMGEAVNLARLIAEYKYGPKKKEEDGDDIRDEKV